VLAVLAAGAYDLTFASVAGTLYDISDHILEGLQERQTARTEASDRASQLL
jgi:hypothetical protein